MLIPVCVGHNASWASRIGRGEDAGIMSCEHDHLFYVSGTQIEGTVPISVGYSGSGDQWRHCINEGMNAGGSGWSHDFTFYAYKTQQSGTIPYAIGHAEYKHGWKYRVSENVTFAGDKGWSHDFVFYAFPVNPENMVPISVGSYSGHWTNRVIAGITAQDDLFQHVFTFNALENLTRGTVPFAVGSTGSGNDRRHQVIKGTYAGGNGWNHEMVFYAHEQQKPGTIPIAVGHASYSGGRKCRISENCIFAGDKGWTHDFVIYAYPGNTSLLMPVAVGFESNHWCTKIMAADRLEESYFQHAFTFYGFRSPYPGTIPVSVSDAGSALQRTIRSRIDKEVQPVCQSNKWGCSNWKYAFTVYVFPNRKLGTIPIAVGHAGFALGGSKCRVSENCENAGTQGWTHDFVFYAYPYPSRRF